jgi:hypothetical protein
MTALPLEFEPVKRCTKCGIVKPRPDFYSAAGGARPFSECKSCCGERGVRRRREQKAEVLAHYGETCACCGTADDLSFDHIEGGGATHRLTDIGSWNMTRWLISNGFPDGYQTLCRPCNASKSCGDSCLLHNRQLRPARLSSE